MRRLEVDMPGKGRALIELDNRNPRTSQEIYENLPMDARANLWGEEVYFETSLRLENENMSSSASPGDVSYWHPGSALCIFFGSTQPYSPVNHIGWVVEGIEIFREIAEGDRIVLKLTDNQYKNKHKKG
jgi:uncharacterized protein